MWLAFCVAALWLLIQALLHCEWANWGPPWPNPAAEGRKALGYSAAAVACFLCGQLARRLLHPKQRRLGTCVKCGYDLAGNTSGVCPECGAKA